jgi:lantibiotic modifying enzyme
MTSERFRAPAEFDSRAGLTLAERLDAFGLSPSTRSQRSEKGELRRQENWRTERRMDIARVSGPTRVPIETPPWLRAFQAAYARAPKPGKGSTDDFMVCVEPLLADARRDIRRALQSAARICPASKRQRDNVLASLESVVHRRLYDAVSRTLVLEMAVAGERNILAGTSPQQRFAFFCDWLSEADNARALLEQYPLLVRRIVTIIRNWQTATITLISRLAASADQLQEFFFSGKDPGPLRAIDMAGDTHRQGQAVQILTFESGRRLVYKPRSLAMENGFLKFIEWINRRNFQPDLKEIHALDAGDFGWMEFVEARPCQARDEIERFFIRQGAQIALVYALGGTDLHFENVIAEGEYPALVDLETLFQVALLPNGIPAASALAWRSLRMSVLGTLLVPQPLFLGGDEHWIDLSALGHRGGQLTPFKVPLWHGVGTDQMRLSHGRVPMAGGVSLPEYKNVQEEARPYADLIVDGLGRMYEFLQKHKSELLSDDSPLQHFIHKPVRHLFRGTAWYARLLAESYHPRFLTDAIKCEGFLHKELRAGTERAAWLAAIEDSEESDQASIDIGLSEAGWRECRARIKDLGDTDRARQTWLVRIAMADLNAPEGRERGPPNSSKIDRDPGRLVDTAIRIGDRLCELAITSGARATWLVPETVNNNVLASSVAARDLYGGLSCIALFLGQLASVSGQSKFKKFAIAAIEEALELHKTDPTNPPIMGAFNGNGGLAYALAHLSYLVDRPEWIKDAHAILLKTVVEDRRKSELDITSGDAGLIVTALAVARSTDAAGLIEPLRPLAKKLCSLTARVRKRYKSRLPSKSDAGFAHGKAGLGFALTRWAEATGEQEFAETAAEFIRSDLETINEIAAKAKTLNGYRERSPSHLGWCRGWTGILLGISSTKIDRSTYDPNLFQRIADEIMALGVEGPICLCHGALGRMELLMAMAERRLVNDPDVLDNWCGELLARLTAGDWCMDDGHALEAPGLMLGLAGTGYELLRASFPNRIPSVLTFEAAST